MKTQCAWLCLSIRGAICRGRQETVCKHICAVLKTRFLFILNNCIYMYIPRTGCATYSVIVWNNLNPPSLKIGVSIAAEQSGSAPVLELESSLQFEVLRLNWDPGILSANLCLSCAIILAIVVNVYNEMILIGRGGVHKQSSRAETPRGIEHLNCQRQKLVGCSWQFFFNLKVFIKE